MKRVTGIGGIFFTAADPAKLFGWYERHLGIKHQDGSAIFGWRELDDPSQEGMTVLGIFKKETDYFNPSQSPFMLNYRVENLDELLQILRAEGVTIDPKREDHEYGRFAWIIDPEGNKIELWEPPKTLETK